MVRGKGTVGGRIRELRETLGLTQRELAKEVGVTSQHISRLEVAQVAPSLDLLVKLSRRLGVSTDYLLTGEEIPVVDLAGAVRARRDLTSRAKRTLLVLVEELSGSSR